MNAKGEVILEPTYDLAADFEGIYAKVKVEGVWGIIDRQGKWVMEPAYDFITMVGQEAIIVKEKGEMFNHRYGMRALNTGTWLVPMEKRQLGLPSDGLIKIEKGDNPFSMTCGYVDYTGKEVIPPIYSDCKDFYDGLAMVSGADMKSFFINRKGETILKLPGFPTVSQYRGGMYAVREGEGFTFYDTQGEKIFSGPYEEIGYYDQLEEGLIPVRQGKLWGYIDLKGNWKIEPQFDIGNFYEFQNGFVEGRAMVKQGGKVGFIDTDGNWVVPPKYEDGRDFSEGGAQVKMDGQWGLIDLEGNELLPCAYTYVMRFKNGLARVITGDLLAAKTGGPGGAFGYVDQKGKMVWKPQE